MAASSSAILAESWPPDGRVRIRMAEAVVSDPPVDEPDVIDLVSRLVGKSLVTTVNAPDGLRYQLLEMLRQYGRDRLAERGDVDRYQQRLLAWATSGTEQLESVIRTPPGPSTSRRSRPGGPGS